MKKIDIYWNLHKKCWSLRQSGKVICYMSSLIANNVEFIVQPAGRERVIRERKKNVHAFVRVSGSITNLYEINFSTLNLKKISYNPYKTKTFIDEDNNSIFHAKKVYLLDPKNCFIKI